MRGGKEKAAAGFDIPVAKDDMRVRIPVRLVPSLQLRMQREMPRDAVLGNIAAKLFDGLYALVRRQLAGQRADEAVGHARVLAVGLLLFAEPRSASSGQAGITWLRTA